MDYLEVFWRANNNNVAALSKEEQVALVLLGYFP